MSRCTGHCCKRFPLPYTLDEIRERQATLADGATIADMLIPLDSPAEQARDGRVWSFFTCKHLGDNGDCRIYATRPAMCMGYPYGGVCMNTGCTARPEPDADPTRTQTTETVDAERIQAMSDTYLERPGIREAIEAYNRREPPTLTKLLCAATEEDDNGTTPDDGPDPGPGHDPARQRAEPDGGAAPERCD